MMSRVIIPDTKLKECVADDAAIGKAAKSTKVCRKVSFSVSLEMTGEDFLLTGSQQQELESRAGMTGESQES